MRPKAWKGRDGLAALSISSHLAEQNSIHRLSSSFVKFTSQEGVYKTKRFGSCTTTIFSGEVFLVQSDSYIVDL